MSEPSRIGLIVHQGRDEAAEQARTLAAWLRDHGHTVVLAETDAEAAGLAELTVPDRELPGVDLIVALGGDGSILRAAELIQGAGVPVLGVDHGQLGYLTEVQPHEAETAIEKVLTGDHDVDERMLVCATVVRADGTREASDLALNEAVVERHGDANTIRIDVRVDGEFFTSYAADGLIVASPTGSTAYSFSARGPIVEPTHRALLLTPISPHMLFDRTLVLSPDTVLRLQVDGHREAAVSIDGRRTALLGEGDSLECTAAPEVVRLAVFGPRHFHRVLKAKFGLEDR